MGGGSDVVLLVCMEEVGRGEGLRGDQMCFLTPHGRAWGFFLEEMKKEPTDIPRLRRYWKD